MATLLSPVEQFVQDELARRQRAISSLNASRNDLLWAYGKTPWIKMQSNAEFSSDRRAPSSYTITSGWFGADDILTFENAHSPIELKPRPGITGMSSTIKGTLGVMREVNVKFKAYTLLQLETLQDLFMIPGIGVLVEWGWADAASEILSIDLRNTFPTGESDKWLKETINGNKKKSDDKDYVPGLVKRGEGRYDALFGLISNFNISFVDDGTWDCDTTIVGPGAMTVDINLKSVGNALDEKLKEYLEKRINAEMGGAPPDSNETKWAKCATFNGIEEKMSVVPSPSEQQAAKVAKDKKSKNETSDEPVAKSTQSNMYVTWEFIEHSLNTFFEAEGFNYAGKQFIQSGLSVSDTRIPCNSFSDKSDDGYIWRSYSPTEVLILTHPPSLSKTELAISPKRSDVRPFDNFKSEPGYGDLGSVWINWQSVVKPAFENSETIQEAINKILNSMNNSAGGIWDLQLTFDSENYNS